MNSRASPLLRGVVLLLISVVGIVWFIALNERLTGPTSQELIDQLVRKQPLPTAREDFFRWSWWNEREDNRIHTVIDLLASDVRRHADALVANCDRTEPCTVLCSADVYAIPVGEACRLIFSGHFDLGGVVYKSRSLNGRHKGLDNYFSRQDLSQWWKTHRHLNDDEIRLLVMQWKLAREDAFGYENEQQRRLFHSTFEKHFASPPTTWSLRGMRPFPDEPVTSKP